eukprot:TRINITY_DN18062_c0_g1_i3.p1 TRINITY_DN18062_c0_g1~~TRINITY_DN18062_c0_g1_i3.p1  ORF type:complete len:286 (-),score=36.75 TRINITY_DN18062_c0_g1_i3:236-1093(-)
MCARLRSGNKLCGNISLVGTRPERIPSSKRCRGWPRRRGLLGAEGGLEDKVKRLVHYSTPMAYGYPEERPFTEASEPGCHASEYARTKHLGDVRIKSLCQGTSLQTVFLYLGCTIGAGDAMTAGRIAAVIRDYIHGKIPMLVGPDTNYIYVHIKDVRRAVAAAVEAPAEKVSGEDFFIANSDDMMTTRQFFALIGKHTGVPPPTRSLPLSLAYRFASVTSWLATNITGAEPTAPVDVIRTAQLGSIEYTCGKSVKVLGMSYASIDEAVAESVADVKQRLGLVAKG